MTRSYLAVIDAPCNAGEAEGGLATCTRFGIQKPLWFWPMDPLVLCLGMASEEAELEARELLFHRAAGRGGTCGLMGRDPLGNTGLLPP